MVCINWVSARWKGLHKTISLEDLCPGGRVSEVEECIAISKECFVRCAVVLALHVSLRLAPGAKGLVESDGWFESTRSTNA